MANELSAEKKTMAVAMLCEGSSIRTIEGITAIRRDTINRALPCGRGVTSAAYRATPPAFVVFRL